MEPYVRILARFVIQLDLPSEGIPGEKFGIDTSDLVSCQLLTIRLNPLLVEFELTSELRITFKELLSTFL